MTLTQAMTKPKKATETRETSSSSRLDGRLMDVGLVDVIGYLHIRFAQVNTHRFAQVICTDYLHIRFA